MELGGAVGEQKQYGGCDILWLRELARGEFLETTTAPHYAGSFEYGARAGHGWNPLGRVRMLEEMAAHVAANAPRDDAPGRVKRE